MLGLGPQVACVKPDGVHNDGGFFLASLVYKRNTFYVSVGSRFERT